MDVTALKAVKQCHCVTLSRFLHFGDFCEDFNVSLPIVVRYVMVGERGCPYMGV